MAAPNHGVPPRIGGLHHGLAAQDLRLGHGGGRQFWAEHHGWVPPILGGIKYRILYKKKRIELEDGGAKNFEDEEKLLNRG